MKRFLTIALIGMSCGGLVVAGCGDDDDDDGDSGSANTTATQPPAETTGTDTAGGTEAGGTVAIQIKDIEFKPKDATIKVGQKVTWTNDDGVPHNVTAQDDGLDSGTMNPGDTYDFSASKPGKINYVCTIHPGQSGTLTIS